MTTSKRTRLLSILLLSILFGGCTVFIGMHLDRDFGSSSPSNRLTPTPGTHTVSYWQDVKPILEARCIVCHGCYDAPCQLDLSAYEGIERGANKELVYNPARLLAAEPTRLFVDADSPRRKRGQATYLVTSGRLDVLSRSGMNRFKAVEYSFDEKATGGPSPGSIRIANEA